MCPLRTIASNASHNRATHRSHSCVVKRGSHGNEQLAYTLLTVQSWESRLGGACRLTIGLRRTQTPLTQNVRQTSGGAMTIIIPNFEWYSKISQEKGLPPRCPFATVDHCPRYYQTISLLRDTGATAMDSSVNDRLFERWKRSPLWPVIAEQETSVSGSSDRPASILSNFCRRFPTSATVLSPPNWPNTQTLLI